MLEAGASYISIRRVRSTTHAAYNHVLDATWDPRLSKHAAEHAITVNPITAVPITGHDNMRDRYLNDVELYHYWTLLNSTGQSSLDVAIRALRVDILLGGQRCAQLLSVRLRDVDLSAGTIALHDQHGRRKTSRAHILPLTTHAKVEVAWLANRAMSMDSEFLFASKQKNKVLEADTVSHLTTEISRYLIEMKKITEPFQFRDIRRTTQTGLAALGVSMHVRAQILSLSPSLNRLERKFWLHDCTVQMRDALNLWEKHLTRLLSSAPENERPSSDMSWLYAWNR